ncbi:MAG: helix-turn-helix domain-containing protein [Aliidiomarina sp.]|uniref:helix-turn-helix domain-containing protein n=1 Tax=Aliidiomarina sp. TaxID=1872439 RepID=UPI0025BE933A|nr:helix-turn-helix domain-containing protein [Aliidiomarina sp.]MCH8500984.1 helix-turn-helix domain-containing protein [Aliidiomarina sp.]
MHEQQSLGSYLKSRRQQLKLSQPELADKVGIEQSFLSKLENEHSLPSTDTFRRWLNALDLTVDNIVHALPSAYVTSKLRQISDIDQFLVRQQQHTFASRSRLLTWSAIALSLSLPIFYVGYSASVFPTTQYEYVSQGLIEPSESAMLYSNWHVTVQNNQDDFIAKRQEIYQRYDERRRLSFTNRGEYFTTQDDEQPLMRRTWERQPVNEASIITRPVNGLLQGIGLGLLVIGLLGFWRERRLYRK